MHIVINPGSGPVADATEENAAFNMAAFILDVGAPTATIERAAAKDYGEGRFAFVVRLGSNECEVQMPGLLLDAVRYTGTNGQNIWHFPRLYTDGSSYVWEFAVSTTRGALGLEPRS